MPSAMMDSRARRAAPLLPALVVAASAWWLLSLVAAPTERPAFTSAPVPRARGRTAVHGFKEDFDAWRAELTPEERAMVQEQAKNEYNKKFRKSDAFKKDLPEEKIQSFSKILKKFFDSEAEDYKKIADSKTPDYEGLQRKSSQNTLDFSLKNKIIEINRDADRRYYWATAKYNLAKERGEIGYPSSTPLEEIYVIKNNDTASHQYNLDLLAWLKQEGEKEECPPEMKAQIDAALEKGVPPMGEEWGIYLPQSLVNTIHHLRVNLAKEVEGRLEGKSEEEKAAYYDSPELREEALTLYGKYSEEYYAARAEVQDLADKQKAVYASAKRMPGKTKADVLKEIWVTVGEMMNKTMPPLDEEVLAELAEIPAVIEEEFNHSWGWASVLYKSEAIDAFGQKYLLGVFETKEEAAEAFDTWNAEYEQAAVDMKAELAQWGKQEQARQEKDTAGKDRIKKVLDEARR